MKGIIWLASYPKSGNTWLRVFITNLERDDEAGASINQLDFASMSSMRFVFDEAVGYKASDLTFEEIDRLRPEVYAYESQVRDEPFYSKIHDAFVRLPDGRALFPAEVSLRAVYIVRNPLDVCLSFAHHLHITDLDAMIDAMANPDSALSANAYQPEHSLRQRLLTWSGHVTSWVDGAGMPLHVLRYEDMRLRPLETFAGCARFLGLPDDADRIARAQDRSSFEELRRQETEEGFQEAPSADRPFFREGRIGSWRDRLTERQVARIIQDHGDVMRRFGYLTDAGEPVF